MKKDARDIAVDAITAFRKRNAWSDGYLRNTIKANELSARDAALATEIVNGVLQNMLLINYYISCFSSVKINKIAPGILDILQVAVYQILFLDRIPDSAAVNDAVNRAKRNNPRAAGFVNAITRKISAQKESLPKINGSKADSLSVKYSHPKWLVERLIEIYGEENTEQIVEDNNKKAEIVIRINTLKSSLGAFSSEYADEYNINAEELKNSATIKLTGSIENGEAFKKGLFHVQDTASQLAAHLLNPNPGSKVLDACAAPGGKSFILAQLMDNSGEIISCDIHKHKISIIESGAKRLGIDIINPMLCDASVFKPEFEQAFDFVLADVPCSGIGIIRKKPDIRYKEAKELSSLPSIQLDILKNVSRYVKPGGVLVYSTCTILPEENECVIEAFLNENSLFDEEKGYADIPKKENKFGITLLPGISKTDGFYMCRLRRKK